MYVDVNASQALQQVPTSLLKKSLHRMVLRNASYDREELARLGFSDSAIDYYIKGKYNYLLALSHKSFVQLLFIGNKRVFYPEALSFLPSLLLLILFAYLRSISYNEPYAFAILTTYLIVSAILTLIALVEQLIIVPLRRKVTCYNLFLQLLFLIGLLYIVLWDVLYSSVSIGKFSITEGILTVIMFLALALSLLALIFYIRSNKLILPEKDEIRKACLAISIAKRTLKEEYYKQFNQAGKVPRSIKSAIRYIKRGIDQSFLEIVHAIRSEDPKKVAEKLVNELVSPLNST